MTRYLYVAGLILAFAWAIFQLGIAFGRGLPDLILLPVHAMLAIAVTFAIEPIRQNRTPAGIRRGREIAATVFDATAVLIALAIGAYFVVNIDPLSRRIPMVHALSGLQISIGIAVIALILEAARRAAGLGMVVVVSAFIAYAMFGAMLPAGIATSPLSLADFIDQMVFGTGGVFGVPLSVSATYVFYFVLFAGFLEVSGGGRLFIDIALRLTKNARGGPAKAAVTGSGLMGMASGSAVANVVSTGVFTIPLMKSAGYAPRMAAAIEALASTGAQIMPPLMGAAAFIMANTLGLSYSDIVAAALLPALLFYCAVFIAVDFEARKQGIGGNSDLPDAQPKEGTLKRVHLLIPLIYLVVCVVSGRPLMMSALEAIGLVIVVSWFRKATRLYPRAIVEALAKGSARVISVAVPCAAAGIVVGVVAQTGIGLRFTEFLVSFSGANLIVALLIVMVGCLIMGMGLPTTAAYIMASTIFAPTLVRIGITPIGAHMFVFYFACLSMITPPVALASYAAASIAQSKPNATGWTAARVGLPLFMLPFAFVSHLELLGQGGVLATALQFATALVGMGVIVSGTIGFLIVKNRRAESWLLGLAGVAILLPVTTANLVGGAVVIAVVALQVLRKRNGTGEVVGVAQTQQAAQTAPGAEQRHEK